MMMMILLLFLLKQNLVLAACPHQKKINAGVALPSPALAVASRLEKTGSRETSEDINPDPGDVQMTTTLKSMTAQRA
jgi:hypothetical protein